MRLAISAALALAAASVISACGSARELDQSTRADGCASCHGFPPATGAHEAHVVAGTFSDPLACESCHVVPATPDHLDGRVVVEFSAAAVAGVANPGFRADGTCAVYCHGSTAALGNRTSPAWTSAAGLACGACHTLAPTSGFHDFHLVPPLAFPPVACRKCHPGYNVETASVNFANHVNGTFDAEPLTTSGTFTSWPGSCVSCHAAGIPFP